VSLRINDERIEANRSLYVTLPSKPTPSGNAFGKENLAQSLHAT